MNTSALIKKAPALARLDYDKTRPAGDRFVEVETTDYMILRSNGELVITSETGVNAIDYYGEFTGGYAWIDPTLEAWAKKNGGYWEWENPGACVFAES